MILEVLKPFFERLMVVVVEQGLHPNRESKIGIPCIISFKDLSKIG